MKTLLFFISLFAMSACSKNDETLEDQLPPATTIGANTAGCLIDGKVLIPKNGSQAIGGSPAYGLNYYYGNNFWPNKNDYWQLEIANKKDSNTSGIILWIKNLQNGNGDYLVDQSNGEFYSDGPSNNQIIAAITTDGINKTYYSSDNSGVIKITRSDLGYGISIIRCL
ncbi:hypothetical protein [Flavobacterium sp.]|uniref:hypothetical protein n=1 Tax=Flavobacterium sp. TaxID=239 RepID=UPI00261C043B|nr:hypothetical protein [Flavobacterium sp.]MDD3005482.1 hypothetical protein [Flavobacterium sp.]